MIGIEAPADLPPRSPGASGSRTRSSGRIAKAVLTASALVLFTSVLRPPFAAPSPSLVVVISVDQLSPEELTRLRPWFGYDGFNRFLKKGAEFSQASYRHAGTFTGPGHASVGTGLDPSRHGIIGNAWFDPAEGKIVHCVEDRKETLVGVPDGVTTGVPAAASPRRLRTASVRDPSSLNLPFALGDRLKQAFPGSRVVGVGLKDRAVVLMAGKDADGAAWFADALGRFVTSSYYPKNDFVPAVLAFNDAKLSRRFSDPACKVWEPLGRDAFSRRVPLDMLSNVLFDPPELFPFKSPIADMGATFPHPLNTPKAKVYSPCGDDLVIDLARTVIVKMQLGTRSTREPDLLFMALSSMDYIGHMFGPDSREAADGVLRLDRSLESFFQWLDENVSRRRVLIWLTSDHGVTPIPEVAVARPRSATAPLPGGGPTAATGTTGATTGATVAAGATGATGATGVAGVSAGRVDLDLNKEDTAPVREGGPSRLAIERTLAAHHGYELREEQPNRTEGVIAYFVEPCFVLNRGVIERRAAAIEGRPAPAPSADGFPGGSGPAAVPQGSRSAAGSAEAPATTDHFHEVGASASTASAGGPGPSRAGEPPPVSEPVKADGSKSEPGRSGPAGASGSVSDTAGAPQRRSSMTVESLRIELRDLLRQIPGVLEAYTHDELAKGLPHDAPFGDAFSRSFDAERTGDVCAVLRPGWIWSNEPKGTTHGQPHPADARVPLLVWGAGVRQGISTAPVSPLAIATTTAALFGLDGVGEHDVPPLGAVLADYPRPKKPPAAGDRKP